MQNEEEACLVNRKILTAGNLKLTVGSSQIENRKYFQTSKLFWKNRKKYNIIKITQIHQSHIKSMEIDVNFN